MKFALPDVIEVVNPSEIMSQKPGFFLDLSLMVCETLKLNCLFQIIAKDGFGEPKNDTWTGTLGRIDNGTFDTSIPAFSIAQERYDYFTFSNSYLIFPRLALLKRPNLQNGQGPLGFLTPLNLSIWLLIFFSVILIASLLTIYFQLLYHRGTRTFLYFLATIENVFLYLVRKSTIISDLKFSQNFLLTFWGYCAIIITNSYVGSLLRSLLVAHSNFPFSDFTTLVLCVESDDCKLVAVPALGHLLHVFSASSVGSASHRLHKALMKNRAINVGNLLEAEKTIISFDSHAFTIITGPYQFHQYDNEIIHIPIDDFNILAFPFRKRDPLHKSFENVLESIIESGLEMALHSKYKNHKNNAVPIFVRHNNSPITLLGICGSFVFLLIGISLGGIALLIEKVMKAHEFDNS